MSDCTLESLLSALLDQHRLDRGGWAHHLKTSESALSQWTHGRNAPKAEMFLRILIENVKDTSSGGPDRIATLDQIALLPTSQTSPSLEKRGHATIAEFLSTGVRRRVDTILHETLSEAVPSDQLAFILKLEALVNRIPQSPHGASLLDSKSRDYLLGVHNTTPKVLEQLSLDFASQLTSYPKRHRVALSALSSKHKDKNEWLIEHVMLLTSASDAITVDGVEKPRLGDKGSENPQGVIQRIGPHAGTLSYSLAPLMPRTA